MKNKKGFTLVEIMAVIVVLGIIMLILSNMVFESLEKSRARAKYIAAQEILDLGKAYTVVETEEGYMNGHVGDPDYQCITKHGLNDTTLCVKIGCLMDKGYMSVNATNPRTGENFWNDVEKKNSICYFGGEGTSSILTDSNDYKPKENAECGRTYSDVNADSYAYYFKEGYFRFAQNESQSFSCGVRLGNVVGNDSPSDMHNLPDNDDCNAILSSSTPEQKKIADMNKDELINIGDVTICNCVKDSFETDNNKRYQDCGA